MQRSNIFRLHGLKLFIRHILDSDDRLGFFIPDSHNLTFYCFKVDINRRMSIDDPTDRIL